MQEKCSILVVDDEPTNVQFLERALRKEYRVLTAPDGFQAIRLVKEKLPDLILLDVMMPEFNGFDVARILKSESALAAIPIVFLTALDSTEAEAEGLGAGGIDYIFKPVNVSLLKLRIKNHLDLKRSHDLIRQQRDLLERRTRELEAALDRVKRLEGTMSICMHCKGIRNARDSWQRIEEYIVEHSDAQFSHCICPECLETHYPSLTGGAGKQGKRDDPQPGPTDLRGNPGKKGDQAKP